MFHKVEDFLALWANEVKVTQKIFDSLTDASLGQQVGPKDRTLGRIAWHIVTSMPEMMGRTGLALGTIEEESPLPPTAREIADAYRETTKALTDRVHGEWTDATLQQADDMYGKSWPRGITLLILITHQTHHRGQMTVLMRQAGLTVPGSYGPAREEWALFGAPEPKI